MNSRIRGRVQVDVDKDDDELKRAKAGYAWESSKLRSWDQIEEDPETGRLKSFQREEQIARKQRRDDGLAGVRRGIIRFMVLIVDMSAALRANDLKPSRSEFVCEAVSAFIKEFFDQNPISQLAVVMTRDAEAVKVSSFSCNEKHHTEAIQKMLRLGTNGAASLQNALNIARKNLSAVPPYGMREVMICYGSLSTCDPGDIQETIQLLTEEKVRCSAIGLGAEVHVLRTLTKRTGGTYGVPLNEEHFRDLLSTQVIPPPTTSKQVSASLIPMGFPMLLRIEEPARYCNNPSLTGSVGYRCSRCTAWLSDMPLECPLCGLSLVSSPHLARSYHHLFPVPKFIQLEESTDSNETFDSEKDGGKLTLKMQELSQLQNIRCKGCTLLLEKENALRLMCSKCENIFCIECDTYIHDSLHYCPGCGQI